MMKRLSVFVALACLGLALPMHAEDVTLLTLPSTASPINRSQYYLYNVGSGKFLVGDGTDFTLSLESGTSSDHSSLISFYAYSQTYSEETCWRLQHIFSSTTYYIYYDEETSNYSLVASGSKPEDEGTYCFEFTSVSWDKGSGYTIKSGSGGYLGYDASSDQIVSLDEATDENAYWILASGVASSFTTFLSDIETYEKGMESREYLNNAATDAKKAGIGTSFEYTGAYREGFNVEATEDDIDEATATIAMLILSHEKAYFTESADDAVVYDSTAYAIKSANLIANPSFRYGFACWGVTSDSFSVETDEDGGYYLAALSSESDVTLEKAWSIEAGKTYYFSYKSKDVSNVSFGVNSESTSVGGALTGTSTTDDDGWTLNEYVFTVGEDYANAETVYAVISATGLAEGGSLTDFELYEVGTMDRMYLERALEDAEGLESEEVYITCKGVDEDASSTQSAIDTATADLAKLIQEKGTASEEEIEYTFGNGEDSETKYYKKTGANQIANPSFRYGYACWTYEDEDENLQPITKDYFSLGEDEDYLTILESESKGSPACLVTAWGIDPAKTYYFSCKTKGSKIQFSRTHSLLLSATEYVPKSLTVLLSITENEGTDWNKHEIVFTPNDTTGFSTATVAYALMYLANCEGLSITDFELCELTEAMYTKDEVKDEVDYPEETPTVNLGSAAFQYNEEAFAALETVIESLEECYYTEDEFNAAVEKLQAAADAANTLNEPVEGKRYKIATKVDGVWVADHPRMANVQGKVATLHASSDFDNQGGYNVVFNNDDEEYLCQAFEFTRIAPVEEEDPLNCYILSYTDETGATRWLCSPADAYEAADTPANHNVLRTTENEEFAQKFIIEADTESDATWRIVNATTMNTLGTSNDGILRAWLSENEPANFYHEIEFVECDPMTVTCNVASTYATVMLPFVLGEEDLDTYGDNLVFYSCSAVEPEEDGTTSELMLDEVTPAANTAYILKYTGDEEEIAFTGWGTYTGSNDTIQSGILVGAMTTNVVVPVGRYVLQDQDEYGVAFYRVVEVQPTMPQYRCYLDTHLMTSGDEEADEETEDINVAAYLFPSTDVETAISSISDNDDADSEAIYDLSGRRVSKPQHGVYIKGGKKVYVK